MRSVRSRTGAWAAVLALILGVVARVGSAQAVEAGRYAPENIEQTYKQMRWLCMVAALCPVSDDVRIVIKRAIEGKPSAEALGNIAQHVWVVGERIGIEGGHDAA